MNRAPRENALANRAAACLPAGKDSYLETGAERNSFMVLHLEFVRGLPEEEFQLLKMRRILYEGSWEEMEKDLLARRDGKPFIFKLKSRIDEDLKRIERLRSYESMHEVDLAEYM